MNNEPKKSSSGIPVIVIVLVLVGVVVAGWYFYKSSGPATNSNIAKNATPGTPTPVATIPANAPPGANPPNMLGSPTALVVVEEFADFQCGSCGAAHPVMKEIQSIYGSRIKMIFRNFPLPMHKWGYDAAVTAEAAGMQGKFWAMHDQLFTNQQTWSSGTADTKALWKGYAEKIGLNMQTFDNDVAGMAAKSRVDQDIARGKAAGVSSTPSVYINGELIPYPEVNVAGLRKIIDAKIAQTNGQQQPVPAQPANAAPANATNK